MLMGAVSGAILGATNPSMFSVGYGELLKQGAGQVIASVFPGLDFSIGNFDFNISPSIALGKGWGVGASVSATFHAGDFALSAGVGIMKYGSYAGSGLSGWEYRKSIMAGTMGTEGNLGLMLGTNMWSGLHSQQTGVLRLQSGDFSLSYENDGKPFTGTLGDGGDSYRTAAVNISIGDYSVDFNLFTGLRNDISYESEKLGLWDNIKGDLGPATSKNGIYYKNGLVNEQGSKYRLGAAYFGYKNYRVGIDSDRHIRHTIQNRWTHNSKFAEQRAFEVIDFSTKPYFQYQTKNQFTSW